VAAFGFAPRLRFSELARVLVHFDHIANRIIQANHVIM
jgi:hypothetical protein